MCGCIMQSGVAKFLVEKYFFLFVHTDRQDVAVQIISSFYSRPIDERQWHFVSLKENINLHVSYPNSYVDINDSIHS